MLAYVGIPKIWGRFVQLQVPHKFCCAPVPLLSDFLAGGGGHVPRQLYGAGDYGVSHTLSERGGLSVRKFWDILPTSKRFYLQRPNLVG